MTQDPKQHPDLLVLRNQLRTIARLVLLYDDMVDATAGRGVTTSLRALYRDMITAAHTALQVLGERES